METTVDVGQDIDTVAKFISAGKMPLHVPTEVIMVRLLGFPRWISLEA